MAGKGPVKVMSKSLANKIAAGEVVERPASVVKELLENAIDAGATAIKVSIKAGGVGEISVYDNGKGMSKEDVRLVPTRFATSKLKTVKGLGAIPTLGFRGEALSSISAVAKVNVASATRDGKGYFLEVEGGDVVNEGDIVLEPGTVVKVRDLFFNVPARRKFLKSRLSETRACWELIRRYLVAYPEIEFSVNLDGKPVISVKSQSQKERITKVIKEPWIDKAETVKYAEGGKAGSGGAAVDGLAMKIEEVGKGRPTQWLFVNRRPIEDQRVKFVVKEAYESVAKRGSPGFVLFLTVPYDSVDVNTHPRKTEVKFKDPAGVYRVIYSGIKSFFNSEKSNWGVLSTPGRTGKKMKKKPDFREGTVEQAMAFSRELIARSGLEKLTAKPEEKAEALENKEEAWSISGRTPIVQVKNAYLLTSDSEGITVIDQHAAAERVLYEEVLNGILGKGLTRQFLLVPIDIEADLVGLGEKWQKPFAKLGIDAEEFGTNTIRIRSLPVGVTQKTGKQLFLELLNQEVGQSPGQDESALKAQKEKVAATIACHSAIKFGDKLSDVDIKKLVTQLSKCQNPFTCPHGRPTMYRIPYSKLESLFERS